VTCVSCRHENPTGARFCNGCGATLEGLCPRCGKPNPAGSRFCNNCGGAVQAAAIAERFADPRSYTPKHLAEKILTSRSALEGERKQVKVLFADAKGAMVGTREHPTCSTEVPAWHNHPRLKTPYG
jgi:double zinc ribbon protein